MIVSQLPNGDFTRDEAAPDDVGSAIALADDSRIRVAIPHERHTLSGVGRRERSQQN
jgi:hypothetical protein